MVGLPSLMKRTEGRPGILVALIDGPVALDLPDLSPRHVRELPGGLGGTCTRADTAACSHGTFVAAILFGRRGSAAPGICPGCTLLLRPIFAEGANHQLKMPTATPAELADAIVDTVDAGAHVINLSSALIRSTPRGEARLNGALDYAAHRGGLIVAAAGNQGMVGSSVITRHPWVIPVVACDAKGWPVGESNLGSSIGRRGLSAPGEDIDSFGPDGKPRRSGGTSAAAPFVTGAIALLWSEFPEATASEVRLALTGPARNAIVPPLMDAWLAYQVMVRASAARRKAS